MLKRCLVFLIIIICQTAVAQERLQFNNTGEFLVSYGGQEETKSGSYHHTFKIFSSKYQCTMQTVDLISRSEREIKDLDISENGSLLLIKTDQLQRIYNLRDGQLIMTAKPENTVVLSRQSSTFIIKEGKHLIEYNSYAQEVFRYKSPNQLSIQDFFYFPGDKGFVIVSNRKQYYFYARNKPNFKRKAFGKYHVVDPFNGQMHIFNLLGANATILSIEFPSMKKTKAHSTAKLFKQYVKDESVGSKEKVHPPKIVKGYSSLSPLGSYIVYATNTTKGDKKLLVHELSRDRIIHTIPIKNEADFPQMHWMNDSILALKKTPLTWDVMHVPSGRTKNQLNFKFQFPEGDKGLSDKKLIKQIQLSPDFRYAFVSNKKSTYFSLGAIRQTRSFLDDSKALFFDPSGNYVLLKKNNRLGLIRTHDIEMDLGTQEIDFLVLSDSCGFRPEDVLGEAAPPIAYEYPKFERIRHISEVQDTTELKIVLQTLSHKDTITEVEFQIMDQYGNYYTGAADKAHRHLWCNLVRQYAENNPEQVDNFTVAEMTDDTPMKLAISVVLDYSGSMGMGRIIALEDGLQSFFENKAEVDAVSIVKYDFKPDSQGPLTSDVDKLKSNLDRSPYDKYGGATALLDGTKLGLEEVQHETEYDERIVIVITDGNENSSFSSKNSVIAKAIEQGVKVYTIGFGDFISESYLKGIAYNTNGGYYRIYGSSDLRWIYEDIYSKIKHFYKIKYVSPKHGKYKALVKLCPETAKSTSLSLSYDNTPVDLSKIDLSGDDGFEVPFNDITDLDKDVAILKEVMDISDFTQINFSQLEKFRRPPGTDRPETSVEKQVFDTLSLPKFEFIFDKTTITNNPEREINQVLDFMKKYGHVSLEIVGHTDNEGGDDYNMKLSRDRAEKVRQLLISKGIHEDRLLSVGMGATEPLVSNETEAGRQTNRRVEFVLIE